MAMGKRTSEQAPMWIPAADLPVSPGHPFYARLNAILDEAGFDRFAEEQCRSFYAPLLVRPWPAWTAAGGNGRRTRTGRNPSIRTRRSRR
jgi:hypothetical protein